MDISIFVCHFDQDLSQKHDTNPEQVVFVASTGVRCAANHPFGGIMVAFSFGLFLGFVPLSRLHGHLRFGLPLVLARMSAFLAASACFRGFLDGFLCTIGTRSRSGAQMTAFRTLRTTFLEADPRSPRFLVVFCRLFHSFHCLRRRGCLDQIL